MSLECNSAWHPDDEPRQPAVAWAEGIERLILYCQNCLEGRIFKEPFPKMLQTPQDYARLMACKLRNSR